MQFSEMPVVSLLTSVIIRECSYVFAFPLAQYFKTE